jgi:CBS domain-containing protein
MKVEDLMTKDVMTCGPDDTLDRAAHVMWVGDCGCVPVVDEARRLVGIITDRDVCMAAYTQGKPLGEIPVATAMARVVQYCDPEDSVAAAEEAMRTHRVRRLPVVAPEGHLAGIISLNDLARAAHQQRTRKARAGVTPLGVSETLAAVCEPRSAPLPAAMAG